MWRHRSISDLAIKGRAAYCCLCSAISRAEPCESGSVKIPKILPGLALIKAYKFVFSGDLVGDYLGFSRDSLYIQGFPDLYFRLHNSPRIYGSIMRILSR